MDFSFEARQQLEQRASPTLITFAQLLQMPGTDLQQLVRAEIEQNPALELVEREVCLLCGRPLRRGICYDCLRRDAEALPNDERGAVPVDDDFDPLMSVAAPRSRGEMLMEALASAVPEADVFIGEYLIGSLDERGFLPEGILNEVVRGLQVSPARARRVLEALQHCGPAGIAARDARECLLLQIERLEAHGAVPPLVRTLVTEHLDELGRGLHTQLSRTLGVSPHEILNARDFIRNRLRPFPITDGGEEAQTWASPSDTPYVTPDVILRHDPAHPGEYLIEVAESRRYSVRLNPLYRRLAESLRESEGGAGMPQSEREHILFQVARAQQFMGHLRERYGTLRRVAAEVVARQKDYLDFGVRRLVPLTRAQIAVSLGLHESTVSRAVADKYVLLPSQELAPFSQFFEAARPVEDVLRELIAGESEPLTDDQLAEQLAERGYPVARRTVAKYRTRLGLLPSHLRKTGK